MKISVTKIWIALVLFAALVFLAIAVTVSQEGKIRELNGQVAELTKQYAAEKQTQGNALDQANTAKSENNDLNGKIKTLTDSNNALKAEISSLKAENENLKSENDKLNQNKSPASPNKYTIAVDQRLDPEIVDLIRRYFDAMVTGNLNEYRATLGNPDNQDLLWYFETQKNADLHITSISVGEKMPDDRLQQGGYFVDVSFTQAGKTSMYDIGVTKKDGKWVIYSND